MSSFFTPEFFAAATILVSLLFYALSGGADYGGGIWELFASGPREQAQRDRIARAIGPVWESNHVWLILAVVVTFTAFPHVFAAISISLNVPLILALIGIVLRGSAFIFMAYSPTPSRSERLWQRIFSISSLMTPFLLGVSVGAIASGRVQPAFGFFHSWIALFPMAVGTFTVALFAYLAAVYLTAEKSSPELRNDFRARALVSWFVVMVLAICVRLKWSTEPANHELKISLVVQVIFGVMAFIALWALWKRLFRLAQVSAICQVGMIILGWGTSQYPYLIVPTFTIHNAAAPASTLYMLDFTLGAGSFVLFPSFAVLYTIFKSSRSLIQRT